MAPALALLCSAAPVLAAPAAAPPRVRDLEETVARQAVLIQSLEARLGDLERRLGAPPAEARPSVALLSSPAPSVGMVPPAGPPSAKGGDTTIKVRGRVHADAWAVRPGASGTELRRARLGAEGRISGALPYVVEVDFAGAAVSLQDAYLDVPVRRLGAIRLGYHKVPFSLDDQTSDNYNLFLEHPIGIDPFTPGRGLGAAFIAQGANWYAHGGVWGEGENDARDGKVDESVTGAGRLVWAPVHAPSRFVHLGLAGYHTMFGDSPGLRLRERPARHLADFAVDTGALDAHRMDGGALEAAGASGPYGLAAEYAVARVTDRLHHDLDFSGWSLEGWWVLTGETRPYKLQGGVFDRLAPANPITAGGPGALLGALRYSALDLTDGPVGGGSLSAFSLGLNWYWTSHARAMVELTRSAADRPGHHERSTSLGARLQYDW